LAATARLGEPCRGAGQAGTATGGSGPLLDRCRHYRYDATMTRQIGNVVMTEKDYVVVGGGIAGLTAAVYLSRSKHDTLLIEKRDRCGGMMNSFTRDGFHFEGGARALVNSGLVVPW